MRKCFKYGSTLLLIIGVCFSAMAQQPINTYSTKGWYGPPKPPFSPVVNKDNSITFRTKAKDAAKVNLQFGEWDVKPQAMARDTDNSWVLTISPVKSGIYSYQYLVDGAATLDMKNPTVKIGTEIYSSIVEVPGSPPRFDEVQDVPHGTLTIHSYRSSSLKRNRGVYIYLPPQYYTQPKASFPVLYLRHGGGDSESSWSQPAGRANTILDNLIAQKKAMPMIVVMTNGLTDGTWAGGSTPEGVKLLEDELLHDVIPLVEKTYRVKTGRGNRAITGLSMGGGQAFIMGLRNLKTFGWIGEFSSGTLSDKDFDMDKELPGIMNATLNQKLGLLWIGCGEDDPRFPGHGVLANTLTKKGIKFKNLTMPGGHEWRVWREELAAFYQNIFTKTLASLTK
nr:esterase [uncultured Mucilaginibacter sp.]